MVIHSMKNRNSSSIIIIIQDFCKKRKGVQFRVGEPKTDIGKLYRYGKKSEHGSDRSSDNC